MNDIEREIERRIEAVAPEVRQDALRVFKGFLTGVAIGVFGWMLIIAALVRCS